VLPVVYGEPMTNKERRRFTRVPFEIGAEIHCEKSIVAASTVRNVSLGGMLLEVPEPVPEGTACTVDITLKGPKSLLRISIEGFVVRVEDQMVAVEFTEVDVDSLIHLRHLIKINADDPEAVEVEYCKRLLRID
jgi:c-di-GMP-binding flagellar brake protein YcgR